MGASGRPLRDAPAHPARDADRGRNRTAPRRVEGATHTVICPTVADALTQLKERLTRVTDLERVGRVLNWDQQTMMPPAGWEHRADHSATLRRIQHETLIADETGRLLDEL